MSLISNELHEMANIEAASFSEMRPSPFISGYGMHGRRSASRNFGSENSIIGLPSSPGFSSVTGAFWQDMAAAVTYSNMESAFPFIVIGLIDNYKDYLS